MADLVIRFQGEEEGLSGSPEVLRELGGVRQEGTEDGSGNVAHQEDDGTLDLGQLPHQRVEREAVFAGREL